MLEPTFGRELASLASQIGTVEITTHPPHSKLTEPCKAVTRIAP